jgi:hypothetical protein
MAFEGPEVWILPIVERGFMPDHGPCLSTGKNSFDQAVSGGPREARTFGVNKDFRKRDAIVPL